MAAAAEEALAVATTVETTVIATMEVILERAQIGGKKIRFLDETMLRIKKKS